MRRLKFMLCRTLFYLVAMLIVLFGYSCGMKFSQRLVPVNFPLVHVAIGSLFAFATNFLVMKLLTPVLYVVKCCLIYCECYPDQNDGVLATVAKVTADWKVTFIIPVLNSLLRKCLGDIYGKAFGTDGTVPEFLTEISQYKLFCAFKWMIVRTLDYVDECITAWCYLHDDYLHKGCLKGMAIFFKHPFKMTMQMVSIAVIEFIFGAVSLVIVAFTTIRLANGFTWAFIVFYVAWKVLMFLCHEFFLEPFMVTSMVHEYLRLAQEDEGEEGHDSLLEQIRECADLSELDTFLRRISGDGEQGGDSSGDNEGAMQ